MGTGRRIGWIGGILGATVALAAALFLRRSSGRRPRPAGAAQVPRPRLNLDVDALAARLGEAVRIQTVSREVPRAEEKKAFEAFRKHLEKTYTGVHEALKREVVAGGTLLYTWEGSDPGLPPMILLAHQDVVPVDPRQ